MGERLPGLPAYDAPPLEGQLSDLVLFGTPDMWFNRMMELNDLLVQEIEDWGQKIQDKINGLSEIDAAIIGGAIGILGGPLGMLGGAAAGALLIGEVKDWLNGKLGDLLEQLWDAHKKVVDAMQACIDGIFGNPEKLMGLGAGYQSARSALIEANLAVTKKTDTVSIFWEGRGFSAYSGAAGQQTAAMDVMAGKVQSASHLMADAAGLIQQCWSDIIQALVALVADVVNTLLGDIEITKLPTATVTTPVGIIIDGVNFLNAVVSAMRAVSIEARTTSFMDWTELSSTPWPRPDGLAANQYANDDNWGTTDQ
ncbi:hypothetical protein [Nocardioides sp.]|uniref:hypothetical protein n=1 Tax=Nocardioides sp. TaxID=35761 RepID=UPI002BDFEA17|nr:hypothetical protein [Nocardioides sp.]HXH81039.1 hypothetical protein [Nocardioides sp.]